jgi:ferredoxin
MPTIHNRKVTRMHRPASQVAEELSACIGCSECLSACPALAGPLTIEMLNRQTFDGPVAPSVARFAQNCILCGACVPVCPVGLHRDAMMLWLKMRLLRRSATANAARAR